MRSRMKALLLAAVLAIGSMGSVEVAFAQGAAQERPVETEKKIARSRYRYLMLGYGTIWVALGVYLFSLNRRIGAARQEIESLRVRLDGLDRGTGR